MTNMIQSGQAQSRRDERYGWQGQQSQITESQERQAEDLSSYPIVTETLSALIVFSATQDTIKAAIPGRTSLHCVFHMLSFWRKTLT